MERREFIKNGCLACLALGAGIAIAPLSSCNVLPVVKSDINNNTIVVDPASFTEGAKALLVRSRKLANDILLVRNSDDRYTALYMRCTHNEFGLSANKRNILCLSHGAEFDYEGKVTKGPATQDLKRFPVSIVDNKLLIHIS